MSNALSIIQWEIIGYHVISSQGTGTQIHSSTPCSCILISDVYLALFGTFYSVEVHGTGLPYPRKRANSQFCYKYLLHIRSICNALLSCMITHIKHWGQNKSLMLLSDDFVHI